MIDKLKAFINRLIRFITYDVWRLNDKSADKKKVKLYRITQIFANTVQNITDRNIGVKASALTYSTLLAIVPAIAILFAIAKGFGFQNIIQSELFKFFAGQETALTKAFEFADTSLKYAQGGVFVGVGIVLLLYTVISLISGVEQNFNEIWNVKKQRSYYRQFTDYLALILIVPVFMVCNSGISILIGSSLDKLYLLDKLIVPVMKVLPFIIVIILFTFVYMYIPNTKVKFLNALFGGAVAGFAFQVFQLLYISGQIWISKYNTIYGSFAALPLLLMWVQLSWYICLIGMLLTQAAQNVKKLNMQKETAAISRRFKDLFILLIVALIVKRFENEEPAYTSDELSEKHNIPAKLTEDILFRLCEVNIIEESYNEEKQVSFFKPAFYIDKITVTELFRRLYEFGSEDFGRDWSQEEPVLWNTLQDFSDLSYDKYANVLIKDIKLSNID